MKKQTLNEEFQRMQKLAGLITESQSKIYEGVDPTITKLASKIEDLPIIDKLADKIQANPEAMKKLNQLAAMYGINVNENLGGGLDLSTIVKKSQDFADRINEGSDDATFTASGVLGGPLLLSLLSLAPGAVENIMQTVNTAIGFGEKAYEPAVILSVAAGVLAGFIIDKIKNKMNENISRISKSDFKNMILVQESKIDEIGMLKTFHVSLNQTSKT
jgi:hypothetical protein